MGERDAWPAPPRISRCLKKRHTNCVRSLPRLKGLASEGVILDPKTNSSLKIHARGEVAVVQCAAEVQLEFRFKPSLFGQTEKPLGGWGGGQPPQERSVRIEQDFSSDTGYK